MSWKKVVPACLLIVLLLIPTAAFAVDFNISNVVIEVHLKENGDADVVEKHTYVFDSKFNGVTREIIAKQGTAITEFVAYENNKRLKVEHEKGTYKIFRSGKKETIEVEMRYGIVNAMEKYEDGAQFYWPFFDKRNETDYGNMTIMVHPPAAAHDVLYLGYDSAYEKGHLRSNGIVEFRLGNVSAGENGDIRVVYETELFPSIVEQNGAIRDEVKAEKSILAEELKQFVASQEKTNKFGLFGVPIGGIFLFILFGSMYKKRRDYKLLVLDDLKNRKSLVPKEKLSMPATIYYANSGTLTPGATAAALLDLVRQGFVKQLSDTQFELIHRDVQHAHEAALIELLFDEVGDGQSFDVADLETYTKNKKNHSIYSKLLSAWRTGVIGEVKQHTFIEKTPGVRWLLVGLSAIFVVGAILFGRYELFFLMAIAAFFAFISLLMAIFYRLRNLEGHLLFEEWKQFRQAFDKLDLDEWNLLETDDKFRAYAFSVGTGDKRVMKQFNEFRAAEQRTAYSNESFHYYDSVFMSNSFASANKNANVDAGGSSTSSSSGGGTGGGGGGSGAF
ncbi:DUF2207 domain-containing protein [Sporosarcina sp. 6E9]|uniref:DUF2207 domain-containing protein n=1 Tax=Sporosarcina sp. 6E9 TaxID=2819235 RepID=UPI001B3168EA|nr:DUF2207 domain-containing protein [Sporosarcina sp. 6E9]